MLLQGQKATKARPASPLLLIPWYSVKLAEQPHQGWNKSSIRDFLQVSRPTVALGIRRFEAEHLAGLEDKSRAPKSPARKVWLPLMIEVYHLQKRHPDAGEFRLWSLLANDTISVRTVGRGMALNKQVYDDIPHGAHPQAKKPPGLY